MGVPPWSEQDLTCLKEYCDTVSKATGVPIPKNYPVMGDDAFRTATGVHAAAVIKAFRKNDVELANTVYSGVPSHYFGMEQIIEIGPMSGRSNVIFWLQRKGLPVDDDTVERIFQKAKQSNCTLREDEIMQCLTSTSRNTMASAD
jgi:2-isopropylmalate synthase